MGPTCPRCGDALATDVVRCPRDGTLVGDASDPLVGATLARRYELLSRLGRGGMASVYLARHLLLDRLEAVKILRADLSHDAGHRARFIREARAVTRIQHENIITVTDYGETPDGVAYLAMEYIAGESLGAALDRERIALPRALEIARQIASGLARAHQQNVVHRDLKPENVLLSKRVDGTDLVKVVDFGIAKVLDAPSLTLNQRIFGTPGYIAPEYATGGAITPRTDLYGLGVVMYEMVTGTLPFDAEHPADLLLKSVVEDPIPPRSREPSLPPGLDDLILRCLARRPEQRPRDAHHFLSDLAVVVTEVSRTGTITLPTSPAVRRPSGGFMGNVATDHATDLPPSLLDTRPPPGSDWDVLGVRPPDRGHSVDAARAWGSWMHEVGARLFAVSREPEGSSVHAAFHALEIRVEAMQDDLARAQQHRVRMLALEARGREFRASIGRAMDSLAADLSVRVRERELLSARWNELDARRRQISDGPALPHGTQGTDTDATLWEHAACGELLADAVRGCEDLEYQLGALSAQIDRLNEALETDQGSLLASLTDTLQLLAAAEQSVRTLAAEFGTRVAETDRSER